MSIVSADLRREIEAIVRTVAERVKHLAVIQQRSAKEENAIQIDGMVMPQWDDLALANGIPGLCLLYGELDRQFPDEEWDLVGHQMLVALQQALSRQPVDSPALWGGLAGVVMGVRALSRGGTRYRSMSTHLEAALASMTHQALPFIEAQLADGNLRMTHYDAIQGVTGVGRTLLLLKDQPQMLALLEDVLKYLVRLTAPRERDGVEMPGWYIKREHLFRERDKQMYPNGNFNLGLSHGITGPMALMALALREGVEVPGQRETLRRIGEWLLAWKAEDEYGIVWPGLVSWEQFVAGGMEDRLPSHQESWCYGAPGIARVLWFAGDVLGETGWKETAVEACRATNRRPEEQWAIISPTFCHGYSGVLHLTRVMHDESGLEELAALRDHALKKVMRAYDEDLPFGYADLVRAEGGVKQVHSAGLLDGAAGIALVLLSLLSSDQPSWDTVFMIR
jgi:lantibiotic biosynthesis protein